MGNKFTRKSQLLQLVRFFASGGATVVADYGTFIALYALGVPLIVTTAASLLAGFMVSFTLNRQWVFGAGSNNGQKAAVTQLVLYGGLFVANTVIAYWIIEALGQLAVHAYAAKAISIVIITTWNFFIYKKVIFRIKRAEIVDDA